MNLGVEVSVHVDHTETFTTVILVGERHAAVGSAKRNPADPHDPQVGADIAMSRALDELSRQIREHAGEGL